MNKKAVVIGECAYALEQACLADLPDIVAIYNQGIGTANADVAPISVASRQAWFDEHTADKCRPIVVLKDGARLVAWASLSNLYDRPAYLCSVEISLYVDSAYHGKGLGSALLEYLLEQATQFGLVNVVALIFGHNGASLALFKKYGFVTWGRLPKIASSQGTMVDLVILGKALA